MSVTLKDKSIYNSPNIEQYKSFVEEFMVSNKKYIDRYATRRLIANRYSISDIKAYIVERILETLQKREAKGNPIKDPKLYFLKLIDYYCVEYQRMYGFIYSMPKRPRYPEAEKEIGKIGFTYFDWSDVRNEPSSNHLDKHTSLGYIDYALGDENKVDSVNNYVVKSKDPGETSTSWSNLLAMVLPEDREIIECIYVKSMSIPEIAKHLKIPISAAYQRKQRALTCISGTLITYIDMDNTSWEILDDVANLNAEDINIDQFFCK